MGSHPVNLLLRFLLEIFALVSIGRWGFLHIDSWHRYVLALILLLVAASVWGVFAVPNDPSRSGLAPIPVPGGVRLVLELVFFSAASWCLYATEARTASWVVGVVVLCHYALSYDRISWLLSQ